MPYALIPDAEAKAAALGHVIVWDTVGERVANGSCARCSMLLSIARSQGGLGEAHGQALEHSCPGSASESRTTSTTQAERP